MSTTDSPLVDPTLTELPAGVASQVGAPVATGRWQPVRGGAVNSWHWAAETFWFANGSLALIGENGSGKSLTATQLFALLDGAVSEVDLSVSGHADGTLTDRHTAQQDQDRTGVWWLEFARTDTEGSTDHCILGLWMRSRSQLQRAWFIADVARDQLRFAAGRNPVDLEDLARQVTDASGRLFIKASLAREGIIGEEESSYRDAVRERLFGGLDAQQFDALLQVLRTARSIRSAENITYSEMNQLLTNSLPAVDQRRLQELADAMQNLRGLTEKLEAERARRTILRSASTEHRSYTGRLLVEVAAELVEAHNAFDHLKGELKKAEADCDAATELLAELDDRRAIAEGSRADLIGALKAVGIEMAGHAGASLEMLLEHAQQLEGQASGAVNRAADAEETAVKDTNDAADARRKLDRWVRDLDERRSRVGAAAAAVGAGPHVQPLADAATAARESHDVLPSQPAAGIEALAGSRRRSIAGIRAAVNAITNIDNDMSVAQLQQQAAEDELLEAIGDADDATVDAVNAERFWLDQATTWASAAHVVATTPDSWQDRDADLAAADVSAWRQSVRAADDAAVDLAGANSRQQTARAAVTAAADELHDARRTRDRRLDELDHRKTDRDCNAEAHQQLVADATTALIVVTERTATQLEDATSLTGAALDELTKQAAIHQTAVERWAGDCTQLIADAVVQAVPLQIPVDTLTDQITGHGRVWPATGRIRDVTGQVAAMVAAAASDARSALTAELTTGAAKKKQAAGHREQVAAELDEARTTSKPPAAPAWRNDVRPGAPLWLLIDRADDSVEVNQLEGALLVAGLLDAAVTPDGNVTAGDLVLTATTDRPTTGTLAELLMVDTAAAHDAGIDPAVVTGVLGSITQGTDGTVRWHDGALRVGPATAAAPTGYRAAHIGVAARERARLALVADLEVALRNADEKVTAAQRAIDAVEQALSDVTAEADRAPDGAELQQAAAALEDRWTEQLEVKIDTDAQLVEANADLDAAERKRDADADRHAAAVHAAEKEVTTAKATVIHREDAAAAATDRLADAEADLERAERQAAAVGAHHQQFPDVEPLLAAYRRRNAAIDHADRCRSRLGRAEEAVKTRTKELSLAKSKLSGLALLDDGTVLPTLPDGLQELNTQLDELTTRTHEWKDAWSEVRAAALVAVTTGRVAAKATQRATDAAHEARKLEGLARRARANYQETIEVAGEEYQNLEQRHDDLSRQLQELEAMLDGIAKEKELTRDELVEAKTLQREQQPLLGAAERRRADSYQTLRSLIDHGLATADEDTDIDENGCPRTLTQALAFSRRVYSGVPSNEASKARRAAEEQMESRIRGLDRQMTEHGEDVVVTSLPGTDGWRSCLVQQTDGSVARNVHSVLESTDRRIDQLENDLDDRLRRTVKATLLSDLRRDVTTRMQLAAKIVADTRATLKGLRTGVANVGVELDWGPADGDDARQMIDLMAGPATDDVINRMWDTLSRMLDDDPDGATTWAERVAAAFDYRHWYTWRIRVTHNDFGSGDGREVFVSWTRYSNPLKKFSTGERRLATLLPPLSAAQSLYAGDSYDGTRLLMIDEADATFDDRNLRQMLGLLRRWEFDTMLTAPKMANLVHPELGQIVLHEIIGTANQTRVSIPWWYDGQTTPTLILT